MLYSGRLPFLPCQTFSKTESPESEESSAAAADSEESSAAAEREVTVSSDCQKHAVCPSASESLSRDRHSFNMFEIDGYEKRQRKRCNWG